MTDKKTFTEASDFHPEVLRLFDQYVHGLASRRGFLKGASTYAAVSGATAVELLDALNPRFAEAQKVAPTDSKRLATSSAFHSPELLPSKEEVKAASPNFASSRALPASKVSRISTMGNDGVRT